MQKFKNKQPLSIGILMNDRGFDRNAMLARGISWGSLYNVLYANSNVSHNTLKEIGAVFGLEEGIHWLHALDRLYVLSRGKRLIKYYAIEFPETIPVRIQRLLINKHPIFISNIMIHIKNVNYKLKGVL